MKVAQYNKFIMSLLPVVTMIGGYFSLDVTPEWWQAVASAVAPILVYLIANKT